MNRVIGAVLAIAGFCGNSCACEGDVAQWSREFIALRVVRGHFDDGPWTASVDRWQGRKHVLMQCLAAQAASAQVPTTRLTQWMGPPDAVLHCPSGDCDAVQREPDDTDGKPLKPAQAPSQLWLYHWRGPHDRLAFTVVNGKVAQAAWAYVHE